MSMQTVDDLEFAEEVAGHLAHTAGAYVQYRATHPRTDATSLDLMSNLLVALSRWEDYCRPTCRFVEEGECHAGDETCGCPCGHDPARVPCPDDPDGQHYVGCGCE